MNSNAVYVKKVQTRGVTRQCKNRRPLMELMEAQQQSDTCELLLTCFYRLFGSFYAFIVKLTIERKQDMRNEQRRTHGTDVFDFGRWYAC